MVNVRIIITPDTYPIQPHHIGEGRVDCFGGNNTNEAAWWLMNFCRARRSWHSFAYSEFFEFYLKASGSLSPFSFYNLTEGDKTVLVRRGTHYLITHEFVAAYFLAMPAL